MPSHNTTPLIALPLGRENACKKKQKQKLLKYQEEARREKNPSALAFLGLQMCVAQAPR